MMAIFFWFDMDASGGIWECYHAREQFKRQRRTMTRPITALRICVIRPSSSRAILLAGHRQFQCLVGKNGLTARKREGDGKSPRGKFSLVSVKLRRDRINHLSHVLPSSPLRQTDGWCDAVGDRNYNRAVLGGYHASHERLWRSDHAYDILIVLDYNLQPRRQGYGSAIFFHIAADGKTFTEGCIALSLSDMRKLLPSISRNTKMQIGPS
jgi:L,D-peptidoglycan transpeptidase YkuD (ErfK/YbiS/YcfS/YnhG family)